MPTISPKELVFALIVEDDLYSARLYGRILDSLNVSYDIVSTREEGLNQLAFIIPELVLLDLNLANKSGFDVFQKIKDDPRYSDTCVIVITAYPQLYERMKASGDHIFLKPINVRQLSSAIQNSVPLLQP